MSEKSQIMTISVYWVQASVYKLLYTRQTNPMAGTVSFVTVFLFNSILHLRFRVYVSLYHTLDKFSRRQIDK